MKMGKHSTTIFKTAKALIILSFCYCAYGVVVDDDDEDRAAAAASGQPLAAPKAQRPLDQRITKDLYIVLIANDPVVVYNGGIPGMEATALMKDSSAAAAADDGGDDAGGRRDGSGRASSRATSTAAAKTYSAYLKLRSDVIATQALGSTAAVLHYYTNAVAGFVAGPLTRGQVTALKRRKDVRAVFPNRLLERRTVSTPSFLGLDVAGGAWSRVGGMSSAGEDIIIAVIDSGAWGRYLLCYIQ
jgi:hypothetical protein